MIPKIPSLGNSWDQGLLDGILTPVRGFLLESRPQSLGFSSKILTPIPGDFYWDPTGSRAQSLGFSGPNPWDFPLGSRPKSMGFSIGILTSIPEIFQQDPDPNPWDFPAPIPVIFHWNPDPNPWDFLAPVPGIFHWDPSPSLCPALAPALPWTPSPKQRENIGISTGIPPPAPQEEIPTKSLEKTTCPGSREGENRNGKHLEL